MVSVVESFGCHSVLMVQFTDLDVTFGPTPCLPSSSLTLAICCCGKPDMNLDMHFVRHLCGVHRGIVESCSCLCHYFASDSPPPPPKSCAPILSLELWQN